LPLEHFRGRNPVRPFGFALDCLHARPREAFTADADSVTDSLPTTEHVVEIGVRRVDHDGSRRLVGRIGNNVTMQTGWNLGGCFILITAFAHAPSPTQLCPPDPPN